MHARLSIIQYEWVAAGEADRRAFRPRGGLLDQRNRSHDRCREEHDRQLLTDVGAACAAFENQKLRNLSCKRIQCDEIWSFLGAKQKDVPVEKQCQFGPETRGRGPRSMRTRS
jgi:hypothetical protein